MKTYIVLLLIISIFVFLYCYNSDDNILQTFANANMNEETKIKKYRSSCGRYPELLEKVMEERHMSKNSSDFDLYIPCSYNSCEKEVLAFENKAGKKLFLIDGCDWIASKLALWDLLRQKYGRNAEKYMPRTFLLQNEKDMKEFEYHYDNNLKIRQDHMYVLKNYAQRQEGIKLTRDKQEIMNGLSKGWYLVQDYVYDPFIIAKRKINFRYYLLITCYQGKTEAYVHKDGFLYYTPEFYDEYDINSKKHITTGYIDRSVYAVNPLTLQDFRDYLECENRVESTNNTKWKCLSDKKTGLSKKWDDSVLKLMEGVMSAINDKICKNPNLCNQYRFQLFGCDVAPDSKLNAKLMEINKGPDLNAKDGRDREVKLSVQRDMFKIIDPEVNLQKSLEETRFVKLNFETNKDSTRICS